MRNHLNSLSRRQLLQGTGALATAAIMEGSGGGRPDRPVYVQLFLRGALDGLTAVVPHGDDDLYARRPTLAIPKPGQPNGAVDLDGFFGLAPSAARLTTPYGNGHLLVVHAAGSIDPTRSHFNAFEAVEFADSGVDAAGNGWMARYLEMTAGLATGVLRGVALSDVLPKTLQGAPKTLPIPSAANFAFPGNDDTAPLRAELLSSMYSGAAAPLGPAGAGTFDSLDLLAGLDFQAAPENGAVYPPGELGDQLRDAATLIKANVGIETITIDFGSWDHHANMGPLDGVLAAKLDELSRGLEAFYLDLLGHLHRYVLVALSEFGRAAGENGSAGTDHGRGNALFVMGGGIDGGRVLADWPGLTPAQLEDGDLRGTTDYRDVISEILLRRMGATPSQLARVFPGHASVFHGVTT